MMVVCWVPVFFFKGSITLVFCILCYTVTPLKTTHDWLEKSPCSNENYDISSGGFSSHSDEFFGGLDQRSHKVSMEKVTGQDLYEVRKNWWFRIFVLYWEVLSPRFKGPFKGSTRSEIYALKKKGPQRLCLGKESHEIL